MALVERGSTVSIFGFIFMLALCINLVLWSCINLANESLITCFVQALFLPPIINTSTTPYSLNTSTTIFYALQFQNEYKLMGAYYDDVTLTFSYLETPEGIIPVANQTIRGFQQKGATYLSDFVSTHSVDVSSTNESQSSLFVVFRVDLSTAVRFRLWFLKGKKRHKFVARGDIHLNPLTGKMISSKRVKLKRVAGHHHSQTAYKAKIFVICFFLGLGLMIGKIFSES